MAWTSAAISSDEITAKGRGYPMLLGTNVLERYNELPQWRTSGVWSLGADSTSSAGPTRLAFDRVGLSQTFSVASGATTVSLIFDLTTSASTSFDTIVILGHNFPSVVNLGEVSVDIANDDAFGAGNVNNIVAWASASDWTATNGNPKRLIGTNLQNGVTSPVRFSNVQYLRLKFDVSIGVFTTLPKVGELWVGRRRQLTLKGEIPFADRPYNGEGATFRSQSGNAIRHSLFSGASDRSVTFNTGGTAIGALDSTTQLRLFASDTNYGAKSFLYIEDPSTVEVDRRVWHMLLEPQEFNFEDPGPFETTVDIGMQEVPPFVSSQE